MKYLKLLFESRYKTHGLNTVKKLLVRKDPNFNAVYYSTQNIFLSWITNIINY